MRTLVLALGGIVIAGSALGGASLIGETHVFADVPDPGFPEGVAVDHGRVWITTPASTAFGAGVGPSTVFGFDDVTGELVRTIVVEGEDMNAMRGLVGIAVDGEHRLYVASLQHGILRFTGPPYEQETYASIPDIPVCAPILPVGPCSPTLLDRPSFPNDMAFDAKGNLFVTDSFQATIWRIPPGGEAEVWFQSASFDGILGANGIRLSGDRDSMFIAVTLGAEAGIYTLPFVEQPAGADLKRIFPTVLEAPDGMAVGASGNLYVTLAGSNQLLALSPDGVELARSPDPLAHLMSDAPYDMPASVAFADDGGRVFIANHALMDGHVLPEHFTLLETGVDDKGDPLERPDVP